MVNRREPKACCGTAGEVDKARRQVLRGSAALAVGVAALASASGAATEAARQAYADPKERGLPQVDMTIEKGRTALVVTDPQIDFLSEQGVTWNVVGESVTEQQTVQNTERLLRVAKSVSMHVLLSPHYYFTHGHRWQFEDVLERTMHSIGMFDRPGPLSLEGYVGKRERTEDPRRQTSDEPRQPRSRAG